MYYSHALFFLCQSCSLWRSQIILWSEIGSIGRIYLLACQHFFCLFRGVINYFKMIIICRISKSFYTQLRSFACRSSFQFDAPKRRRKNKEKRTTIRRWSSSQPNSTPSSKPSMQPSNQPTHCLSGQPSMQPISEPSSKPVLSLAVSLRGYPLACPRDNHHDTALEPERETLDPAQYATVDPTIVAVQQLNSVST